MYDELIGRLRVNGELFQKYIPNAEGEILLQAADAIEQLSNAGSAYGRGWTLGYDAGRSESKPRWIPVTERLPCLTTPVLVTDGIEVDTAWMYGVPPRWITSFTAIDEDKLTHWMPLPKTPKGK